VIGLLELLSARGFVPDANRVKLVRHKDSRWDLESLKRAGWFDTCQKYQSKPVFDGCDQIVVFFGEEGFNGRFIGVYDVGTCMPAAQSLMPPECPHPEWAKAGSVYYPLEKRSGFEDLEDRVVIDWGKAALAWHQWFTADRPVVEIRAQGRALPPFRDYLRVRLSFDDLVRLTAQPDAHRDWLYGLSAVGAIYLVVNGLTGEQYVGSATGNGGLWQRWCDYAKNGHGNNLRLKEVCAQEAGCPAAFTFSILETFSRSLSREEALSMEAFFKQKLGTRAFGLNAKLQKCCAVTPKRTVLGRYRDTAHGIGVSASSYPSPPVDRGRAGCRRSRRNTTRRWRQRLRSDLSRHISDLRLGGRRGP
jgi:hypothetical protein